jgi:hypothetical protein
MKTTMTTALAAALALTSAASALNDDFEEQRYSLDGKPVYVWTDSDGAVEIRRVPGWQERCPFEQRALLSGSGGQELGVDHPSLRALCEPLIGPALRLTNF